MAASAAMYREGDDKRRDDKEAIRPPIEGAGLFDAKHNRAAKLKEVAQALMAFNPSVPYFPELVNPAFLQSNWKLLEEVKIEEVIQKFVNKNRHYYQRSECGLPYDILKGEHGHYAVYRDVGNDKEVVFAEGKPGTEIKLAQCLETGTWYLLKTARNLTDRQAQVEVFNLDALGLTPEYMVYTSTGEANAFCFLMKLERGDALIDILNGHKRSFLEACPELLLLRISVAIVTAYKTQLRKKGFIHGDIKPQNLIYDFITNTVRFVDVANAVRLDVKQIHTDNFVSGTAPFAAPEIFKKQCSVASDIYSLGVTLDWLLLDRLIVDDFPSEEFKPHRYIEGRETYFSRFTYSTQLNTLLNQMHHKLHGSIRPSIETVEGVLIELLAIVEGSKIDEVAELQTIRDKLQLAENNRLNMLGDLWRRLPKQRVIAFWDSLNEVHLKQAVTEVLRTKYHIQTLAQFFQEIKSTNRELYERVIQAIATNMQSVADFIPFLDNSLYEFRKSLIEAMSPARMNVLFAGLSINHFADILYQEEMLQPKPSELVGMMRPPTVNLQLFIKNLFAYQSGKLQSPSYEETMQKVLQFLTRYFDLNPPLLVSAIVIVNQGYQDYLQPKIDKSCFCGHSLFSHSNADKMAASRALTLLAERNQAELLLYLKRETVTQVGELGLIADAFKKAIQPAHWLNVADNKAMPAQAQC